MSLTTGSDVPESVWETPLGRWRLAWVAHLNGQPIEAPVPDPTLAADAVLAHEMDLARSVVDAAVEGETCPDEIEADAAVGIMPAAALVYAEPGADA